MLQGRRARCTCSVQVLTDILYYSGYYKGAFSSSKEFRPQQTLGCQGAAAFFENTKLRKGKMSGHSYCHCAVQ